MNNQEKMTVSFCLTLITLGTTGIFVRFLEFARHNPNDAVVLFFEKYSILPVFGITFLFFYLIFSLANHD